MVAVDVAEQEPFETVTEYVPLVVTVIDCVVAPFDQVFPVADEDVRTTEPPAQNVVGPPAVMVGTGGTGFTVTVVEAAAEVQPFAETVSVYVPAVETTIDCVVSVVDQVFPVAAEEVSVTDPPVQNVNGPLAVMVGVAGIGLTVTTVARDEDEQLPLTTVTV